MEFKKFKMIKLCFSTLGCSELSLDDILSMSQNHGIPAVEIRGISGVMNNLEITDFCVENHNSTKNKLKSFGIIPIVLGTSCAFHNEEKYNDAINEGLASIKIAEALGIKNIRVFGDRFKPDSTERIISGISLLCESTDKVNVLLEVHGDYNTIDALRPITDTLSAYGNFGLIWDIGHTHRSYGENWMEFYGFARPFTKHVHIKDISDKEQRLVLIGHGNVPIKPIVEKLISDGYDGYFSLEWEKKWHPELEDMPVALDSFIKVMNEVACK